MEQLHPDPEIPRVIPVGTIPAAEFGLNLLKRREGKKIKIKRKFFFCRKSRGKGWELRGEESILGFGGISSKIAGIWDGSVGIRDVGMRRMQLLRLSSASHPGKIFPGDPWRIHGILCSPLTPSHVIPTSKHPWIPWISAAWGVVPIQTKTWADFRSFPGNSGISAPLEGQE